MYAYYTLYKITMASPLEIGELIEQLT